MSAIPDRLEALRAEMRALRLTHYVIPSSDEHLNEYLPTRNMRREWASGFSGSAGDLLVGCAPEETFLFTDGRYHLQAERQLAGSGIALQKLGTLNAKPLSRVVTEFAERYKADLRVGVDPFVISMTQGRALEKACARGGAALVRVDSNLVDRLWTHRPSEPSSPLLSLPLDLVGASIDEKLGAVRSALREEGADSTIVVKLDQIAWLLNLRALEDVPYNPVFLAYLIVSEKSVDLFVHAPAARLRETNLATMRGLTIHEYSEFRSFVAQLPSSKLLFDPDRATLGVWDQATTGHSVVEGVSPLERLKARKNESEVAAMKRANLLASVAKTRAVLWLRQATDAGEFVTEAIFRDHIEARYRELDGYQALSFHTISAAGDHGALPHYSDADATPIRAGELLVIDSGIQARGGTTDDTRTLGIGTPTAQQKRFFTLVLRAHIRGAAAVFPEGTTGVAIDALVRSPLWAEGLNYDHGTGHGVGAFLNVHEGPFQIGDANRRPSSVHPLELGMVTSIEPGYYALGFGGVRHENLYVVVLHHVEPSGRRWFAFESLTYIPFDCRFIDFSAFETPERKWLDEYHAACRERLAPFLGSDEARALSRYLQVEP